MTQGSEIVNKYYFKLNENDTRKKNTLYFALTRQFF